MTNRPETIRFTVEERILLHLLDYTSSRLKIEVPSSLTQAGISQGIRIQRKHLPRSLKKMKEKNLIQEKTAHVKGKTQRMKTYHLTLNGEAKARELKEYVTNLTIYVRDKSGRLKKTTIHDVKNLVTGLQSLAQLLSHIDIDGIIDLKQTTPEQREEESHLDRLTIYKKALEQAWKDGKMERSEQDILINPRESLQISEKEHIQLEEQILADIEKNTSSIAAEAHKVALEQALADNRISADERAILEKIKKHFHLKDSK